MRLASWNVNSLKVRMDRVPEWLAYAQPDVLCLQETKLADAAFPHLAFAALGYESVHHGSGQWNGVAILSRIGAEHPVMGFADGGEPDQDTRLITATCAGITVCSVYVPNGRSVGSEHYAYKLQWLARLRRHLDAVARPSDRVIVFGDFNIAPEDKDVWDPAAFVGSTHVTPQERQALADLQSWGLVDAFRTVWPEEKLYTYWDYRAGDFHEHRGMRIDLLLGTDAVTKHARWALVDRNARKGKLPSDHAPLFVDVDI
ncbi:MAG TPA: exodeoxyribonuclease III [Acidimicrobiales bacterium]|nr:exodeoxyribonuclease III [Acidimicrobiales bacterium]